MQNQTLSPLLTDRDLWNNLTLREREVALHIAIGATNRDVAAKLDIGLKTYDTHRGHVLQKLGARHNVDICRMAIRLGLVDAHGTISGPAVPDPGPAAPTT